MYSNKTVKSETPTFKHFARKSYSLFSALGREVKIGVLSAATLLTAGTAATAQTTTRVTTDKELKLEEVVISASRAPISADRCPRMVTVLESTDIASIPAQSINDIIKYVAGADVRQRGPLGAQADISLRGGTSEQIAILLNGINICDPQTGHNAFQLPVTKDEILRVEILEGPSSRIYGTSSLIGAINIITRQDTSSSIQLEGGSHGYLTGSAASGLRHGRLTSRGSISHTRSDGYTRNKAGQLNSDFRGSNAYYHAIYDHPQYKAEAQIGWMDKHIGANTYYSSRFDNQYEAIQKKLISIKATSKGRLHLTPSISWNRHNDRFELIRGDESTIPFNYHQTDVITLSLGSYFDTPLGRTSLGADMRNEDWKSNNKGEPLHTKRHIHGTSHHYTHGLNRTNTSLYLEHNLVWRIMTLSAGITAAKNSWNEMNLRYYPGADLSLRPLRGLDIYASANKSLRMPSFTELYYSDREHISNKYLKPEEASSIEGGIKYHNGALDLKASAYLYKGSNMIDWIRKDINEKWQSVNYTRINTRGINIDATLNLLKLLPGQQIMHSLRLGYNHIDQDKKNKDNILSKHVLEYLKDKLTAHATITPHKSLRIDINYMWQQRAGYYNDGGGKSKYSPYGLLDARIAWKRTHYEIYAETLNLLDKDYIDYGGVPQPGRWITTGIKIRI